VQLPARRAGLPVTLLPPPLLLRSRLPQEEVLLGRLLAVEGRDEGAWKGLRKGGEYPGFVFLGALCY
jgi:hypothetical protein